MTKQTSASKSRRRAGWRRLKLQCRLHWRKVSNRSRCRLGGFAVLCAPASIVIILPLPARAAFYRFLTAYVGQLREAGWIVEERIEPELVSSELIGVSAIRLGYWEQEIRQCRGLRIQLSAGCSENCHVDACRCHLVETSLSDKSLSLLERVWANS